MSHYALVADHEMTAFENEIVAFLEHVADCGSKPTSGIFTAIFDDGNIGTYYTDGLKRNDRICALHNMQMDLADEDLHANDDPDE